jgi:NAD(P)-dependent dehydrogenase (short-subunit alcohol dehydrogenase family)
MSKKFAGKIALVIGGSSGMGLTTAGISRTSRGARIWLPVPVRIHKTPLGLACADETFAIRRELPMPIEQFRFVYDFMR